MPSISFDEYVKEVESDLKEKLLLDAARKRLGADNPRNHSGERGDDAVADYIDVLFGGKPGRLE